MNEARRVVALLVLAVAGVAVACGTTTLGPRDEGPAVTNASSLLIPTATAPAPPAETVTVEEEQTTASTTATDAAITPGEPVGAGVVYFIRYDRLEAEAVRFPDTVEPARAALDLLVAGPTPAEQSLRYSTQIPQGTTVRSFVVGEDGTATIDLSREFQPPSTPTALGPADLVAIYQIVYTVTERPEVQRVELRVEGTVYPNYFAGLPITRDLVERAVDEQPADELDFRCTPDPTPPASDEERPFFLGAPRDGSIVQPGDPVRITGVMRLPADVVVVRVLQYRTEVRHAISASGCDGTFSAELGLPPSVTGPITLEAYIPSVDGKKRFQSLRELLVE